MYETTDARTAAFGAVHRIQPFDSIEATHRRDALHWIRSGVEVFRIVKPDVPPKHLVAYCVLVDPAAEAILLVDHRNAGRWLATGGHVDPGEHPFAAARREIAEELGAEATPLHGVGGHPLLVTQSTTFGVDAGHVDVSLWYVVERDRSRTLAPDPSEFAAVDWWKFDAVLHAGDAVDPHLPRFVAKLAGELGAVTRA
ncbi:MAG: NUDIX hydrolase [Acidimicrobiia bacterium]